MRERGGKGKSDCRGGERWGGGMEHEMIQGRRGEREKSKTVKDRLVFGRVK